MKTVFSYLSSYKARMAFGLFLKAVGTFAELVLPLIMAYMIDDVAPTQNALALSLWGAAMLVCAVAALTDCAAVVLCEGRAIRPRAFGTIFLQKFCLYRPVRSMKSLCRRSCRASPRIPITCTI